MKRLIALKSEGAPVVSAFEVTQKRYGFLWIHSMPVIVVDGEILPGMELSHLADKLEHTERDIILIDFGDIQIREDSFPQDLIGEIFRKKDGSCFLILEDFPQDTCLSFLDVDDRIYTLVELPQDNPALTVVDKLTADRYYLESDGRHSISPATLNLVSRSLVANGSEIKGITFKPDLSVNFIQSDKGVVILTLVEGKNFSNNCFKLLGERIIGCAGGEHPSLLVVLIDEEGPNAGLWVDDCDSVRYCLNFMAKPEKLLTCLLGATCNLKLHEGKWTSHKDSYLATRSGRLILTDKNFGEFDADAEPSAIQEALDPTSDVTLIFFQDEKVTVSPNQAKGVSTLLQSKETEGCSTIVVSIRGTEDSLNYQTEDDPDTIYTVTGLRSGKPQLSAVSCATAPETGTLETETLETGALETEMA